MFYRFQGEGHKVILFGLADCHVRCWPRGPIRGPTCHDSLTCTHFNKWSLARIWQSVNPTLEPHRAQQTAAKSGRHSRAGALNPFSFQGSIPGSSVGLMLGWQIAMSDMIHVRDKDHL